MVVLLINHAPCFKFFFLKILIVYELDDNQGTNSFSDVNDVQISLKIFLVSFASCFLRFALLKLSYQLVKVLLLILLKFQN